METNKENYTSQSLIEKPPYYKDDLGWTPENYEKYKELRKDMFFSDADPSEVFKRANELVKEIEKILNASDEIRTGEQLVAKSVLLRDIYQDFFSYHKKLDAKNKE